MAAAAKQNKAASAAVTVLGGEPLSVRPTRPIPLVPSFCSPFLHFRVDGFMRLCKSLKHTRGAGHGGGEVHGGRAAGRL